MSGSGKSGVRPLHSTEGFEPGEAGSGSRLITGPAAFAGLDLAGAAVAFFHPVGFYFHGFERLRLFHLELCLSQLTSCSLSLICVSGSCFASCSLS